MHCEVQKLTITPCRSEVDSLLTLTLPQSSEHLVSTISCQIIGASASSVPANLSSSRSSASGSVRHEVRASVQPAWSIVTLPLSVDQAGVEYRVWIAA